MINIKKVMTRQYRDRSDHCQKHCSICRNPCEKQSKYVEKELPVKVVAENKEL